MEYLKVIGGQLQGLVGLPGVELLLLYEPPQVIMVGEEGDGIEAAFQVMTLLFHCGDHGEQLLVVSLVVLFRGYQFPRPECYRPPMAVLIWLQQHST